jgi:hypothetical protein
VELRTGHFGMLAAAVLTGDELKLINDVFGSITQGAVELKVHLTGRQGVFEGIIGDFYNDGGRC